MIDQLEFENLIEKLKKRKEEGDFKTAVKVADKVPWEEVEDINVLMFAASIYDEAECYKDAKGILDYAYEIAPVKNRLYFALSLINIKCKELKDGISFYMDFCNAFPDDIRKLLLQYYIVKAKGATYDQQKRLLAEYIEEEKDEKMTFELALICDKLGQKEEVLRYCNFIIDFFGIKKTGYGKNALLLKKKYMPLNEQEEKILEGLEIGYVKDEDKTIEYTEPPEFYNDIRIDEDKINIPEEKVERVTNIETQRRIDGILHDKDDELDESKVNKEINISYTPDEESYDEKEKNIPAFMGDDRTDKGKLKRLINELKTEEELSKSDFHKFRQESFELNGRLADMKLNETKLHMIIEAHSKDEGIDIAKKELNYIHDVLGEHITIGKVSAYTMNENGFEFYLDKIRGKDLIIENAGQLKNEVIDRIEEYIINKEGSTIFALIDVINNFDKIATDRPSFVGRFDVYSVLSTRPQETLDVTTDEVEKFKAKRNGEQKTVAERREERREEPREERREEKKEERRAMPKTPPETQTDMKKRMPESRINTAKAEMSVDEFVEECKAYAKSIDCALPGETIPALYDVVEEMKEKKVGLNKDNAVALIEEAADRAEKPKLFSKPKYDKDGCLVLLEEHFNF